MADTLVYGRIKPDVIENTRILPSRGKQESAFLIILMGSAAAQATASVFSKYPADIVESYKYIVKNKGSVFLTVITGYPNDIVSGFDNFDNYWPEPPFNQAQVLGAVTIAVLTNYQPYSSGPDVISSGFRRKPTFYEEVYFIKEQKPNIQALIFIPIPPVGDLSTQYKRPVEFFETPFWDQSQENAGRMVVMMPQLAPRIEVNIYAGGGKTLGKFFKNVLLGRFH